MLGPIDQTDPTATDAHSNPGKYLVQNGKLTLQPNLSLAVTSSGSNYVVTATLDTPPSTPPAQVTFTVAGQTFTEPLTNGQAALTLAIHPSLTSQLISVQAAVTGCVGAQTNIGAGTLSQVALQVTAISGAQTVCPVGPGSKALVRMSRLGFIDPDTALAAIATALQDILTVVSPMAHILTEHLIPQATASAWAPVTVDTSALQDFQLSVQPSLPITLDNLLSLQQYVELKGRIVQYQQAAQAYDSDVQDIPGLA